jgi:hypothetical protein
VVVEGHRGLVSEMPVPSRSEVTGRCSTRSSHAGGCLLARGAHEPIRKALAALPTAIECAESLEEGKSRGRARITRR